MADWSRLLPAGERPPEVTTALGAVEALRAKLPAQRQALSDAEAAVTTAEADDRTRMAEELRAGRNAKADPRGVEKAQQRVASARREGEALALAVQASEDALGEVVRSSRGRWLADAQRTEKATRGHAQELVAELRSTLERLAEARVTAYWLQSERGLAREARPPGVSLGVLAESGRVSANTNPLSMLQTLDMLEQTVAEPAPPTPPPEPTPLKRIEFGGYATPQ